MADCETLSSTTVIKKCGVNLDQDGRNAAFEVQFGDPLVRIKFYIFMGISVHILAGMAALSSLLKSYICYLLYNNNIIYMIYK